MSDTTTTTAPVRTRRRYSDVEQAEALAVLAANGGDCAATAAATGYAESTIRAWANGDRRPPHAQLCAEKKEQLAQGIEKLARRVLKRALKQAADTDERVSLRDGAVVLGICVDKIAQLRGEANGAGSITVNVDARSVTLTSDDIQAARRLIAAQTAPAPLPAHEPEQTS